MEEEGEIVPGCSRVLHRRRKRNNRFGKKRKEIFLEHLAATCNVTESAAEAGVAVSTVYANRMRDPEFRDDWMAAVQQGYARLEAEALESRRIERAEVRGDKIVERANGLSFDEKMQLLRHHQRALAGTTQRNRPAPARVPIDQVAARLVKKLKALGVRPDGIEAGEGDR